MLFPKSVSYAETIRKGEETMEFDDGLGSMAIQEVLAAYPGIGGILARYDIGCVTCKVGICLLKDVVAIHGLAKEDEARIEAEINDYLKTGEERTVE
jgi:hypothetical protein